MYPYSDRNRKTGSCADLKLYDKAPKRADTFRIITDDWIMTIFTEKENIFLKRSLSKYVLNFVKIRTEIGVKVDESCETLKLNNSTHQTFNSKSGK